MFFFNHDTIGVEHALSSKMIYIFVFMQTLSKKNNNLTKKYIDFENDFTQWHQKAVHKI